MTDARKFLIDDITAMMPSHKVEFLSGVSDEGLYRLWLDLVNLTTLEAITE
jgi:hypothetical protein